ncbi:MAG: hypothetical protein ACLQAT_03425 [Candidatus Binataceae bacterium]
MASRRIIKSVLHSEAYHPAQLHDLDDRVSRGAAAAVRGAGTGFGATDPTAVH